MRTRPIILAACLAAFIPAAGLAQTTPGSAGCAALTQAGINGAAARVAADDTDIGAPQALKSLTCLDKFFNGTGLNVVANLLDPTQLLNNIEGELCTALTSSWQKLIGNKQCGITLTGFKNGFFGGLGGLGGGLSCPKLTFGGGGPPIGYIGTGNNNSGRLYVNGAGQPPSGYNLPPINGLW